MPAWIGLISLDVVIACTHAHGAIIRRYLPPVLYPIGLGSGALNALIQVVIDDQPFAFKWAGALVLCDLVKLATAFAVGVGGLGHFSALGASRVTLKNHLLH